MPAGTTIIAGISAINCSKEIWGEDAQEFKPERWLVDTDAEVQKLRSAYFPFSLGTRGCIGKNMALLSIYLVVARLTVLFDIESRDPLPLEFHVKDHFAAGGKEGPFLKFTPATP